MPTQINERLVSWASDIDEGTILQAEKTARLPIVEGYVALMPDAHVGIGATVGSVIPTKNAVIPSAVGVDIGCGMVAAELDVTEDQLPDSLEALLQRIEQVIPAGVGKGHDEGSKAADKWLAEHRPATKLSDKLSAKALNQFGTLGSGNHFFELCVDERGRVWVVLHSGSRGVGNRLGEMHIGIAKELAKGLQLKLEDPNLAYLVEGTPEFDGVHHRHAVGTGVRPGEPRHDDERRDDRGSLSDRHGSRDEPHQLPPQLQPARDARRRRALGDP